MAQDPHGPEIVVGQLQFEFDDIAPLTLEERLRQWLNHKDEETTDALTAILFIGDSDSRRHRADRWSEILGIQAPYTYDPAWMVSGGIEAVWLYMKLGETISTGPTFPH